MQTKDFLKRYAYVYFYAAAFFLACAGLIDHAVETAGSMEPFSLHPVIVIDPGHGGMDGGTTGAAGVSERDVNLAIAGRLNTLLQLLGCETVMTRTTDGDISTEGQTIRQRKMSDLKNRTALVNGYASALLVSIHQNHFPDSRYYGPQVFWANGADDLAKELQAALNAALVPKSGRSVKQASGVYLMERVTHPAVLVECGFLSNPVEEQKLSSAEHQKKLACVMAAVLAAYAKTPAV